MEVLGLTKFRQFQGFSESVTNRSYVCCRLLLKDVTVVLSPVTVFTFTTMLWSGKAGNTFDLGCVALIGDCGLRVVRSISLSVISSQTENTAYRLLISHPHTSTTNLNLSISFNHSFPLSHSLFLSVLITLFRSLSFCSEANLPSWQYCCTQMAHNAPDPISSSEKHSSHSLESSRHIYEMFISTF